MPDSFALAPRRKTREVCEKEKNEFSLSKTLEAAVKFSLLTYSR